MCSVNPELPNSIVPPPASMSVQKKALGGAALLLTAWVGYSTLLFPGHRALTWFELCSDGSAPDWLATDARDVTGSHYKEALERGFLDEISDAVLDHLSQWGGGDVLELAAGTGAAADVWHSLFVKKGLCTRTILTDIQPDTQSWDRFSRSAHSVSSSKYQDAFDFDCGTYSYVASPVDSTHALAAVDAVVPNFGVDGRELRMIHLALHHFSPDQVHQMLEDATASNAALLIVDHSPNAGGALYNGALAFKQLLKLIPGILLKDPLKILLVPFAPLIIFANWHDATVSILRSYSQAELKQMIRSAEGGDKYDVKMFRSAGYGEWIGIPAFLQPLFPGIDDQVMNFVLATPNANAVYSKRRVRGDIPTPASRAEINQTILKVYGTPAHAIPESPPVTSGMQVFILLLVGMVSYKFLADDKPGKKRRTRKAGDENALLGAPAILAVGTANPPHAWQIDAVHAAMDWKRQNIDLSVDYIEFMRKVHKTSGVDTRWFGEPTPDVEKLNAGERPDSIYGGDGNPTVSERHAYWNEWAPKMAIEAATQAINEWGGNKSDITHVICHSCTGFKAPGIELDVIDTLKLTNVRRRLGINYMGCFGAFTGMSVAKAFCEADPEATVLLVCTETCFPHIAFDENRSKCIGNCFFADGAGAMIVGAGKPGDWAISDQQTKTLGIETRQLMTWQPNDHCYDMFLDKSIGLKFGMHLYWNLKSYLREVCPESVRDIEWCVHPGGKGILDFFCSEKLNLGIDKTTLKRSYDVLRNYGNMSSGTIMFVLKEMMRDAKEDPSSVKPTAVCFGFGPGLTLEVAELRRIGSSPGNGGPPSAVPKCSSEDSCKAVPSDITVGTEDETKTIPSDVNEAESVGGSDPAVTSCK